MKFELRQKRGLISLLPQVSLCISSAPILHLEALAPKMYQIRVYAMPAPIRETMPHPHVSVLADGFESVQDVLELSPAGDDQYEDMSLWALDKTWRCKLTALAG